MDDWSGGQYATDVLEEKYCVVFRADSLRHPQGADNREAVVTTYIIDLNGRVYFL